MKEKQVKIFKFSSLFICLCLLVAFLVITSNKQEEQNNVGDLIINTESGRNLELRAKSYVEEGVTKVTVNAITTGSVSGLGSSYDTELNWTLEWASVKEEEVTDYVALDILGKATVQLTYLKQFDTQIILKATSIENTDVFATCTIDCYKRSNFDEYKVRFDYMDYEVDFTSQQIDLRSVISMDYLATGQPITLKVVTEDNKVGTVETTTNLEGYYTLSTELQEAFNAKGYEAVNQIAFDKLVDYHILAAIEYMFGNEFELFDREDGMLLNQELQDILIATECWFELNFSMEDSYEDKVVNSYTTSFDVLMKYNPKFGEIVSVKLSKDSIII